MPKAPTTVPTSESAIPGEALIRAWAAPTGVAVDPALQQARQMFGADPALLAGTGTSAADVGGDLDMRHLDLQSVTSNAKQNWEGEAGMAFGKANGLTAAQVRQARQSTAKLSNLLTEAADSTAQAKRGVITASAATAARLGMLGQDATPAVMTQARQALTAWVSAINGLFTDAGGDATGATAGAGGGAGGAVGGAAMGGGGGAVAPSMPLPPGQLTDWIEQARQIMIANGVDPKLIPPDAIYNIIMKESGGNPNAINNWDSNAAAGHPSQGLMQTIPTTFSANLPSWAPQGTMTDPIPNIIAGSMYSIARYGGVNKVWNARSNGYFGY